MSVKEAENIPSGREKRSLIKQYISEELFVELYKVTLLSDMNNNDKGDIIKSLLSNYSVPYTSLGTGTNRMAVLVDGYAMKIALDSDGRIDNRREMLYTKDLQPYVIKVYECVPNGLIAISEYVSIFTLDDFHTYQPQMRSILDVVSQIFLIGDVGITGKNYINWGLREDGTICMLDFAYIYAVKYKLFVCSCDSSAVLRYDKDFVTMKCPVCGRKYTFGEIRKKITREKQEMEIGDIRRLGYNLTQPLQEMEPVATFSPFKEKKKKKILTEEEERLKKIRKGLLDDEVQNWDFPDE